MSVGSHTLEFRPRLPPSAALIPRGIGGENTNKTKAIKISADSPAASTLLIFQAIFPFLLFSSSSDSKAELVRLEISGGTNVSFSPSFEYVDQVLLPMLEVAYGIAVKRTLHSRGWSLGKAQRGRVEFEFAPLRLGETLKLTEEGERIFGARVPDASSNKDGNDSGDGTDDSVERDIEAIDVSMIVPQNMHESLTEALVNDLEELFPCVEVNFKIIEDSGADSRIYVLLVARAGSLRWGRDILTSAPKNAKEPKKGSKSANSGKGSNTAHHTSSISETISRQVSKELFEEVSAGGLVDEYLQDQMVIFQALAEGRSSVLRSTDEGSSGMDSSSVNNGITGLEQPMKQLAIGSERRMRRDKTDQPFGEGSMHTTTARWVTAQLLPTSEWFNKGKICQGVGMRMEPSGKTR